MSKNQKSRYESSFAAESVDAFGGLDSTGLFGKLSSPSVMTNLRLLADGSIETRSGYSLALSLPAPIVALHEVPDCPGSICLLAGDGVYLADTNVGSYTRLGHITPGDGGFFRLGQRLHLVASGEIFNVLPDGLYPSDAYVPLYGRNWDAEGGEVFEPRNLLCRSVRITYRPTDETSVLGTTLTPESIESVVVNGTAIRGAILEGSIVRLPATFPAQSEIELVLTLPSSGTVGEEELLLSCTQATTLGVGESAVACLYSGEEPDRLFLSRPTSDGSLYFPEGGALIADIPGGITAVAGYADRFLVFGDGCAHIIHDNDERPVSYTRGCVSGNSIATDGETIYTADRIGVCRWSLDGTRPTPISDAVEELTGQTHFARSSLGLDPIHHELHVSCPSSDDGGVLVFNTSLESWYYFDSIGAEQYFYAGGIFGFTAVSGVFVFGEDGSTDIQLGGGEREIIARYVSRYSDLGRPDDAKRLFRLELCLAGGGDCYAVISDAIGQLCQASITGSGEDAPRLVSIPISSARTRFVRAEITLSGTSKQRIFGLTLRAAK